MNSFLIKNNFFVIAIGAVPAAILRWQVGQIFIINILGCFLLGLINSLPISRRYKLCFGFGFCSSLTTFSGWSSELFKLINLGYYKLFLVNSILIVMLGVFSCALGNFIAKQIVD